MGWTSFCSLVNTCLYRLLTSATPSHNKHIKTNQRLIHFIHTMAISLWFLGILFIYCIYMFFITFTCYICLSILTCDQHPSSVRRLRVTKTHIYPLEVQKNLGAVYHQSNPLLLLSGAAVSSVSWKIVSDCTCSTGLLAWDGERLAG